MAKLEVPCQDLGLLCEVKHTIFLLGSYNKLSLSCLTTTLFF